ncbi:MAG: Rossmann-fold NAD(P)-binding domain-containing protein [Pseudohaliea sp.]
MSATVLFVGAGDLAARCAAALSAGPAGPLAGARLVGLRRDVDALPPVFEGLAGDYADPAVAPRVAALAPDFVVTTFKPRGRDEAGYRRGFADAARYLAEGLAARPPRQLLLVSSTRVYAEKNGGWVDETSPLATRDTDPAAAQIVAAEDTLAAVAPVARLRCAGIYGGADGFLQRRVASGSLCPPTPVHYSNRIHRDDVGGFLAHLLAAAAGSSALAPACNVVDDLPVPQATVEAWLAEQLGVPESERRYDARALSRGHKRIRNRRLHESGYRLRYPDYRAGYAAALAAED